MNYFLNVVADYRCFSCHVAIPAYQNYQARAVDSALNASGLSIGKAYTACRTLDGHSSCLTLAAIDITLQGGIKQGAAPSDASGSGIGGVCFNLYNDEDKDNTVDSNERVGCFKIYDTGQIQPAVFKTGGSCSPIAVHATNPTGCV